MRTRLCLFLLLAFWICSASVATSEPLSQDERRRPPVDTELVMYQVLGGTAVTVATGAVDALIMGAAMGGDMDDEQAMGLLAIANIAGTLVMTNVIGNIGKKRGVEGSPLATFVGGVAGTALAILLMIEATDEFGTAIMCIPMPAAIATLGYQLTRKTRSDRSTACITIDDGVTSVNPSISLRRSSTLAHDATWLVDLVQIRF